MIKTKRKIKIMDAINILSYLKRVSLIVVFALAAQSVMASHVVGGQIHYRHIGGKDIRASLAVEERRRFIHEKFGD